MVLLLVDAQESLVNGALYGYERFVEGVKQLIGAARQGGTEVLFVRHDDGTELTKRLPGFEIFPGFAPVPGERIFDKHVNSPFKESGLLEYLAAKRETAVMTAGLQTDYCMDATVKCGFEHGLQMIVPAGCNTTVDNEFMTGEASYRYYNEQMWNRRYARCVRLEEALAML